MLVAVQPELYRNKKMLLKPIIAETDHCDSFQLTAWGNNIDTIRRLAQIWASPQVAQ